MPEAVARLNAAAARTPTVPVLHRPDGADPAVHTTVADGAHDLTATLAQAAVAFLAGPDRQRLRALPPQGAPAPGVVQALLRKPRMRRSPPRPVQDPPGA
ncbi:ABATE domain-containing protein [Streptomyces sp. NPDC001604]|uniref:ABATE domain-containing protein n=1 Tax=Streptomyces sp. NPDC001604 TaxID=3364593 RepID=UPI003688B63D